MCAGRRKLRTGLQPRALDRGAALRMLSCACTRPDPASSGHWVRELPLLFFSSAPPAFACVGPSSVAGAVLQAA